MTSSLRFVALCALLAACSKAPSKQLADTAKSLSSWAASSALTARHWSAGALPDQYASKSVKLASDETSKAQQAMQKLGAQDAALDAAAKQLDNDLTSLSDALAAGDRSAAADAAARLERDHEHLEQEEKRLDR